MMYDVKELLEEPCGDWIPNQSNDHFIKAMYDVEVKNLKKQVKKLKKQKKQAYDKGYENCKHDIIKYIENFKQDIVNKMCEEIYKETK